MKKNYLKPHIFKSIIFTTVFMLTIMVALGCFFNSGINHWLWLFITLLFIALFITYFVIYIKPFENLANNGNNLLDVFLISSLISFSLFAFICLPDFKICLIVNKNIRFAPTIISIAFASASLLFIFVRTIFKSCSIKTQKESKQYFLYDFINDNLPEDVSNLIISDNPVCTDVFERKDLIDEVFAALTKNNGEDKCVLGITGKWGSGKTTYLNIAFDRIRNDKHLKHAYIICDDFSAWRYDDEKTFLISLLKEVYRKLNIGSTVPEIKQSIIKFSKAFTHTEKLSLFDSFFDENDVDDELIIGLINEFLTKNSKRLLFVIDDIDREDENQIRFIYKVLSNVLKLKNVTFICLFDEDYIAKLTRNTINGNFLEKCLNLKINVEPPTNSKMFQIACKCLENYFKRKDDSKIPKKMSTHDLKIIEQSINVIENPRQLIIVLNKIFNYFTMSNQQLDLADLFAITTIRTLNKDLIEFLLSNPSFFVIAFREYVKNDSDQYTDEEIKKKEKKDLIENYFGKDSNFKKYVNLLNCLFPHSLEEESRASPEEIKSANIYAKVCSGKYFKNYFIDSPKNYIELASEIRKGIEESIKNGGLENFLEELFNKHFSDEYSYILGYISDWIDTTEFKKDDLTKFFHFFSKNYYSFSTIPTSSLFSSRIACRAILAKIFYKAETDFTCADSFIERLKTQHKGKTIYIVRDINNANKSYVSNYEWRDVLTSKFDSIIYEEVEKLVETKTNVFSKDFYERGVVSLLSNYYDKKKKLNGYYKAVLDENNVFCFLNDFVEWSYDGFGDKESLKYYMQLKHISGILSLDKIKKMVDKANVETTAHYVIKDLFYNLYGTKSQHNEVFERTYLDHPYDVNDYFGLERPLPEIDF